MEDLREKSGLPKCGFAVDLACGSGKTSKTLFSFLAGRDGIYLALRGWKTLNFDYSANQIVRAKVTSKSNFL
jgi:hypothetical protein